MSELLEDPEGHKVIFESHSPQGSPGTASLDMSSSTRQSRDDALPGASSFVRYHSGQAVEHRGPVEAPEWYPIHHQDGTAQFSHPEMEAYFNENRYRAQRRELGEDLPNRDWYWPFWCSGLLLLTACWREAHAPPEDPVVVSARWLTPERLDVQIRTTQHVCLSDQLLGRNIPGFREAFGPYQPVDRGHQWTESETCELVISLSHQHQLGVTDVEFVLPSAVRCLPAGSDLTRVVNVPQPWTYWHPDEFVQRPLSHTPRAVRVDVGWTDIPPAWIEVLLTTGERVQMPEVRWLAPTTPPFLTDQRIASARVALPEPLQIYRIPGDTAPSACRVVNEP